MATNSTFKSVKLAAALVDDARSAALTMRRSVASQIEYWATLGRALESAGLTARDTGALIAHHDSSRRAALQESEQATLPAADAAKLSALKTRVVALAKSGALGRRASKAVAANSDRAVRRVKRSRPAG